MIDAALIQQRADRALKPEIVEMFIERAGAQDPLTITVRSGNRVVLVPKPTTPDEALARIRDNLAAIPCVLASHNIQLVSASSRQVS
jgi:hypothetical protein